MGILKFTCFRVRQTKGNLRSWACKGYTSTSKILTFASNVKQGVLNDEKRQSLIPVYATFYRFIMTFKLYFPLLDFFSELNRAVK